MGIADVVLSKVYGFAAHGDVRKTYISVCALCAIDRVM